MSDLAQLDLLWRAQSGELEPLAAHLEAGGHVGPGLAQWLAAHLRGEHPKRRGRPRASSQVEREMRVELQIRAFEQFGGLDLRQEAIRTLWERSPDDPAIFELMRASRSEAIAAWLEDNPDVPEDTLRSWLKNMRRRVKK